MNKEFPVIGFIGAGRVGFTLGRYFVENGLNVSGYYSRTYEHAVSASQFTDSKSYKTIDELIAASSIIFITVNDSQIQAVWELCKKSDLTNKILCHCSGAMTASVFSGIEQTKAYGYSVHLLFSFNDKYNSYKDISKAFFTVEGDENHIDYVTDIIKKTGNEYVVIDGTNKDKYHGAAVFVSNLVIGLFHSGKKLLMDCGFCDEQAQKALIPLFINNAANLSCVGESSALTGPVDRNDLDTVKKNINCLDDDYKDIYVKLSRQLVEIAKNKYRDADYSQMEKLLSDK